MAFVSCCDSFLAVASSASVVIVHRETAGAQPIILSSVAPDQASSSLTKGEGDESDEAPDSTASKTTKQTSTDPPQVLAAHFSNSGTILAVCNNRKQLIIYRYTNGNWEYEKCWLLSKQATALTFVGEDDNTILIADRYGQVTQYGLTDSSGTQPMVLLGHVSILLDMVLSRNERYLLSADRDEKIRVSHYPNCYNIQSFCLGHQEYIRTLCVCPGLIEEDTDGILASGGGDGHLKLWRYTNGTELVSLDLSETGRIRNILCLTKTLEPGTPVIRLVVSFEGNTQLSFLDIGIDPSGNYKIVKNSELSIDNTTAGVISDMTTVDGKVYVLLSSPADAPLVEVDATGETSKRMDYSPVLESLNKCEKLIQSLAQSKEESPPMEKVVQFDNVGEYMDRKKARIETQSKSKSVKLGVSG